MTKTDQKNKLLIAGGGTGGHIFPGIAIAEEWKNQGGNVIFVGTPRGQEKDLVPKNGFSIRLLSVGSLKGAGLLGKLKTILKLPFAILKARKILKEERPDLVLGIGGYASGPILIAAWLMRYKTAITDQNIHPGITNRTLGKVVKKVFLSFEDASPYFNQAKVTITGNPVRSSITFSDYPTLKEKFHIFIFGGSQGAVSMNKIIITALNNMKDLWPRLKITHQSGKTDLNEITNFYEMNGIEAITSSFFNNMNDLYKSAHLVIARSGAGAITELTLSGRPSILIPYPFAADNHQLKNAEYLSKRNAAITLEQKNLTPEVLEKHLRNLLTDDLKTLKEMAKNAKKLAKPQAARDLVAGLLSL